MKLEELNRLQSQIENNRAVFAEQRKSWRDLSQSSLPAMCGWAGGLLFSVGAAYVATQAYWGLSAMTAASSSLVAGVAPTATFVATLGTAFAGIGRVTEGIKNAVVDFVEQKADRCFDNEYNYKEISSFLSDVRQGVEKGCIREFLTRKEVEQYLKDPRYIVMDSRGLTDGRFRLDKKAFDNKENCLTVRECERYDRKEKATVFLESDMIAFSSNGLLVFDKESAVVKVCCENDEKEHKEMLVREFPMAGLSEEVSVNRFADTVRDVQYYNGMPKLLLEEGAVRNGLQETVTIPADRTKDVLMNGNALEIHKRGGDDIVIRADENRYARNEDGSITVTLNNPFTNREQKEMLEKWTKETDRSATTTLSRTRVNELTKDARSDIAGR